MMIVFTTLPSQDEAKRLARNIVEKRLAACVQILPPITSIYFWENEVQKSAEVLILIKTLAEKYTELEDFIRANHSYKVPEIAVIPAEKVSESYLLWMKDSLQ